jgi:ankyrin repeat protein
VRLLLARDANINASTRTGKTPLHLAVFRSHPNVSQLLLAKGADPNAEADGAETPLHWAVCYNRKTTALLLLQHCADTEARTEGGATALHYAVLMKTKHDDIGFWVKRESKKIGLVQILLDHGADVTAKNGSGQTALDLALEVDTPPKQEDGELLIELLRRGAERSERPKPTVRTTKLDSAPSAEDRIAKPTIRLPKSSP